MGRIHPMMHSKFHPCFEFLHPFAHHHQHTIQRLPTFSGYQERLLLRKKVKPPLSGHLQGFQQVTA